MEIVDTFPHEIIVEEHVRIPVTDGLHLSAKIWRPKDGKPVPAILEYIPYRKRFGTKVRDAHTHPFLAGHGYACVRLDIRGSGESEGVLLDEYLQSELDDGVAAIEWIAAQDWCDGNLGMMGISWGGFNGLQIAALQPEALKAIVTVSSTDDRYSDDIHHMGGTLLGDNLSWSGVMFAYNALPPDPALVGDRWREMWLERLDHARPWIADWLTHQRRDAYWRHGSICEDYDAVKIPVFAVSGWTDGYTNSVFRLMEHLKGPRKGLIGPWGHIYPHFGRPGPAIDFLGEMLRWWDRWLKGIETGVEDDPMICAWMQESVAPNTEYDERPGRWVAEPVWPSSRTRAHELVLGPGRDLVEPGENIARRDIDVQSPVTSGLASGKWCSYANAPDLAGDQRIDDGGGLVFQTEPLEEDLELLGAPEVELTLSSDRPDAIVAVRLSDMRPDHQVTRLSYGLLNLTHRDSRQHPEKLEPGKSYTVRVPMNYIAERVPAGHRLRLTVSTVYWPLAWTPPEPVKLTIKTGESRLILPHRPVPRDDRAPQFGPPRRAPSPPLSSLAAPDHRWLVKHDLGAQVSELEVIDDRGIVRHDDIGLTVGARAVERYTASPGDFASAAGESEWTYTLSRDDWSIHVRTRTRLTADRETFHVYAELDAYEGEKRIRSETWTETIPRDHV